MKFFDLFKRPATPSAARRAPLATLLEPRMLFDGAVAATVADAASTDAPAADANHTQPADNTAHPASDAATPPASSDQRQEIIFVDGQLKDAQALIAGLPSGAEVVVLDSSKDGLQQIADYLKGREGVDAIHLLSHGAEGTVELGSTWLNTQNITEHSQTLSAIGAALASDGDILLYGCDTGAGSQGAALLADMARLTQADVAASADATGTASRGGNWVLERQSGTVETNSLALGSYNALLAAPVIGNLNGDSVAWAGVGSSVTLDASGNATVSDAELGALNGGNGDWDGATLQVQRNVGAISSDVFGFNTVGAAFTISGNTLRSGGLTFATFTFSGGNLSISFVSIGTTATTAMVQDVMSHITYRSDTPAGDATVRFTLSDGSGGSNTADVVVISDTIYITNTTDTATIDISNGVSFSEAVAIAAADGTGSQTLVFTSALNSGMSLAGNLAIAESLTINADAASGLSINGSTITLGGGTTLTVSNASGTVTIASALAGSGALNKAGISGTLALTSMNNEANMSGGISVTGGSLQITLAEQLSSGTLTLNGGTLTNNIISLTLDNAI
ncbi:MAG: DUF4347 domain-containing protein, partial [Pseudomonas sp.]